MHRLITLLLLFALPAQVYAQNQTAQMGRLEVSLGGGLLVPVGKFASNATDGFQQSVFTDFGVTEDELYCFCKEGHGHANTGYEFNFEINYLTKRLWVHGISLGRSSNSVNTSNANDYFRNAEFLIEVIEQSSYTIHYLSYTIGRQFSIKNVALRPFQKIGISQLEFPYYNLNFPEIGLAGVNFDHAGEGSNSNGLYLETGLLTNIILSKQVSLGLNLSYRFANYEYSMLKSFRPGGSERWVFPDQVNFKAFQAGVRLTYAFSFR